jgi:hypothetical protein
MKIMDDVLWVVTLPELVGIRYVSERHTDSIFKAEEGNNVVSVKLQTEGMCLVM